MKKYVINSMPIMKRETVVYAKNEDEAWDIYWGDKKGKIEQSDIGDLEYTDVGDYLDPEMFPHHKTCNFFHLDLIDISEVILE